MCACLASHPSAPPDLAVANALTAGLTATPERMPTSSQLHTTVVTIYLLLKFPSPLELVSPIGRNCSQSERDDFEKYDHQHKIRSTMVSKLESEFADYGLKYSIGGQVQDST